MGYSLLDLSDGYCVGYSLLDLSDGYCAWGTQCYI